MNLQLQTQLNLEKGLVVFWSFDEGEGGIVFDKTENHNDGALLCKGDGCSPPKWVKGQIRTALEFDGKDDYIVIPYDNSIDVFSTNSWSVAAWFKTKSKNQQDLIHGLTDRPAIIISKNGLWGISGYKEDPEAPWGSLK